LLFIFNVIVTALFCVEMVLKVISQGLFMSRGSYLRDWWNVLDFAIVVMSIISLTVSSTRFIKYISISHISFSLPKHFHPDSLLCCMCNYSGLRALRALRPLRLVITFQSTRIVLGAIINSLRAIVGVVIFGFILFNIFAIVGVQFFGGRLRQCISVPSAEVNSLLDYEECMTQNSTLWANPHDMGNFDTVFSATLVVFELATQENWPSFMYRVVDATPPLQAPSTDHNQWAALYFIAAITICSFFYVNLFVGSVVGAYDSHRGDDVTVLQAKWLQIYRVILDHPAPLRVSHLLILCLIHLCLSLPIHVHSWHV
jgi:hypothetical protein